MQLEFGRLMETKRKEAGITLRGMATLMNLSPTFWSDIEKGRRNPPDIDKLEKLAQVLRFSSADKDIMFDLAGKAENTISPDLPDYIMSKDYIRTALRKARQVGEREDWERFIRDLDKKLPAPDCR